jgi:gas vesicle protein
MSKYEEAVKIYNKNSDILRDLKYRMNTCNLDIFGLKNGKLSINPNFSQETRKAISNIFRNNGQANYKIKLIIIEALENEMQEANNRAAEEAKEILNFYKEVK